ncbi:hypothetical protein [Thalassotalea ganghwensis]
MIVIFLSFLLFIVLPVVSIRYVAVNLGAATNSYRACIIATVAVIAADLLASDIFSNSVLAFIVTFVFAGFAFSVIFRVGYKQSVVIAIVSFLVNLVASSILVGLGVTAFGITR